VEPQAPGAQVPAVAAAGEIGMCEGSEWWQLDKKPQASGAHVSSMPATAENGVDRYGVRAYASVSSPADIKPD